MRWSAMIRRGRVLRWLYSWKAVRMLSAITVSGCLLLSRMTRWDASITLLRPAPTPVYHTVLISANQRRHEMLRPRGVVLRRLRRQVSARLGVILRRRILRHARRHGRTGNQIDKQRNPVKDEYKHEPDPLLQARQVDQRADPGHQVRNPRQSRNDHARDKERQIAKVTNRSVSGGGRRKGTPNNTRNDQARADQRHNYVEDEEEADGAFPHG